MAKSPAMPQNKAVKQDFFSWPIVCTVFLLTTLIFFSDILFGKNFFWDDITEYVYPMSSYAARMASSGQTPFWNPYTFSGMPFLADFQAQYFYPAHWIFRYFLEPATGLLKPGIIEFIIILHFFIAQLSMAFLARFRKISMWGSILAGISWAFCGSLATRTNHPMIVYHMAFLPLILMHFEKGLLQQRWLNILYTALLLGLIIISGHAQTSAYILIFLAVYGIWMLIDSLRKGNIKTNGAIAWLMRMALPVLLAAGIVAVQYLPGQELASYSERSEITYEKTTDGSMTFGQLFTAVIPSLYGQISGNPGPGSEKLAFSMNDSQGRPVQTHWYWDTAFYFGISALILGTLGIFSTISTPFTGTLISVGVFAFLYGLGNNGFLHGLFWGVPVFGQFRNPGRMMFYLSFGFSILSGHGFDSLKNLGNNLLRSIAIGAAFPLLIALLTLISILPGMAGVPENLHPVLGGQAGRALLFIIGTIAVIFLYGRTVLNAQTSGIILCILAFTDLHFAYKGFHGSPKNPKDQYIVQPELQSKLSANTPESVFRVSMRNQYGMAMARNGGMNAGIMLYEGYNPILLQRRNPPLTNTEQIFDLLNIKYILKADPQNGSLYFAERPTALGHARMVYQAITESDGEQALRSKIAAGNIDFRTTAILEKQPGIVLSGAVPDSVQHSVKIVNYTPNEYTVSVNTAQAGILCLSDIWYPAWKASIDGNSTEILRSNWSMRAIQIPAGNHSIRIYYDSDTYHRGYTASMISLCITLAGIGFCLVWERRKKANS
jgi:hypothetical protein